MPIFGNYMLNIPLWSSFNWGSFSSPVQTSAPIFPLYTQSTPMTFPMPSFLTSGTPSYSTMSMPLFSTYTAPAYTQTSYNSSSTSFKIPSFLQKSYNYVKSGAKYVYNGAKKIYLKATTTAKNIIDNAVRLATSQEGVHETARNDSVQIRQYKNGARNSNAWCASFISWCFGRGQNRGNGSTFGYTASSQAIRKSAGQYFHKKNSGYKPRVGDILIWTKPNDPAHGHVGMITAMNGDKISVTQGNTSDRVRTITYDWRNVPNNGGTFNGFIDTTSWYSAKA